MDMRRFGRTGLDVSAFTLGGGYVGGVLINPEDDTRAEALRRAVAAGCNWIDTAADYGKGESERALGRLLPGIGPRPHLSTKVRLDTGRLGDLPGEIRRSLEESLARLKVDRVELFQLHNPIVPRTGDGKVSPYHAMHAADVFDRLRGEGLFDWFGLTALGEAGPIVEVLSSGRYDTAQVYYNMLNPSAGRSMPEGWTGQDFGGIIEACTAREMGIMNIRVLAGGALTGAEPHGREVIVTSDADVAGEYERARKVLRRLGDAFGSPAQTAIRYALANPDLSTIVVGLASLAQLDEALEAFAAGPLPPDALDEIEAVFPEL
ncbi:MAG TPA: aldo/keto reductase [Geminicoccaceae bacterium]|nr:aldo/keto reductase [Geminicoccus sp.]HMU51106.1 aldo/keto reductase [Geminicoccaceae bacterium]